MSISGALSNALSGITAASRQASLVSSNIANAMTDGYGRRELSLAARTDSGGGVQVISVQRLMDGVTLSDRRAADGSGARAGTQLGFLDKVANAIGEPGSGNALTDLVNGLETSLVSAAEQPESMPRLTTSVDAAARLAGKLAEVSGALQVERGRADAAIGEAVAQLNTDLARVEQLNRDILRAGISSDTGVSLTDARQVVIDRISELVPVREIDRGNGVVALLSEGGMLVDGPAGTIGFQPVSVMTPHLSLAAGTLSGITLNGQSVDMTRDRHALSGGALDGLVAVRDQLAPQLQADLDAVARDLMERFEAPAVDPTRAPGAPGLFTDAGAAFAPANEIGLSGRIAVNAAVDPAQGGGAWRMRDGLGAAVPGSVGDASGLQRLSQALAQLRAPASGSFGPSLRSSSGLGADLLSNLGGARAIADSDAAYAAARSDALGQKIREQGVDTDAEMQTLLLIEQAYAANARVISAAQGMLDTLLEI